MQSQRPLGSNPRKPPLWAYVLLSVVVSVAAAFAFGLLTFEPTSDTLLGIILVVFCGIILGLGEYTIFHRERQK